MHASTRQLLALAAAVLMCGGLSSTLAQGAAATGDTAALIDEGGYLLCPEEAAHFLGSPLTSSPPYTCFQDGACCFESWAAPRR
jgi:hypothetical protein